MSSQISLEEAHLDRENRGGMIVKVVGVVLLDIEV